MIKQKTGTQYGLYFSVALIGLLVFVSDLQATRAAGLDAQVAKVGSFMNGPVLKTGMSAATIIGTIGAAVRGSLVMAAGIMGVGIALAFYLGWLNSESFIQ